MLPFVSMIGWLALLCYNMVLPMTMPRSSRAFSMFSGSNSIGRNKFITALRKTKFPHVEEESRGFTTLPNMERIYILSDLHTDHVRNMEWLQQRCASNSSSAAPGPNDALIIAGDISHDLVTFENTIVLLQNNLKCSIFFVPGNHEAWMDNNNHNTSYYHDNSISKLNAVIELCQKMGVYTTHCLVGTNKKYPLWIVPIHSWYDGSLMLQDCEDFIRDFPSWPWVDFIRCQWPAEHMRIGTDSTDDTKYLHRKFPKQSLVQMFLQQNEGALQDVAKFQEVNHDNKVAGLVTFSHFLPNQQSLPDWKDLREERGFQRQWLDHPGPGISAKFALVAGSARIDEQIRTLQQQPNNEHIHVLGHSHRPKDFCYKGIRYIHHPLGKPQEREMQMISPNVNFKCIWDTSSGSVPSSQILRYWEEHGGGLSALTSFMKTRRKKTQTAGSIVIGTTTVDSGYQNNSSVISSRR